MCPSKTLHMWYWVLTGQWFTSHLDFYGFLPTQTSKALQGWRTWILPRSKKKQQRISREALGFVNVWAVTYMERMERLLRHPPCNAQSRQPFPRQIQVCKHWITRHPARSQICSFALPRYVSIPSTVQVPTLQSKMVRVKLIPWDISNFKHSIPLGLTAHEANNSTELAWNVLPLWANAKSQR